MVNAVVENGNLLITGDSAANQIAISSGQQAGQVVIQGATDTGTSSGNTRVNNQTGPVTLSGVTGNIIVNLGDGDDKVVLTNLNTTGLVELNLGAGNDQAIVRGTRPAHQDLKLNDDCELTHGTVNIGGALRINGQAGDDVITVNNAIVGGNLRVTGGNGNDTLLVRGQLASNRVGGSVFVDMGRGDDVVDIRGLRVTGGLNIQDRFAATRSTVFLAGVQVGQDVRVDTSDLNDTVKITNLPGARFTARNVVINTYDGNDYVLVNQAVASNLHANTGAGNDVVQLQNSVFRYGVLINIGNGADRVMVNNIKADVLRLNTGNGPDTVKIGNVDVRRAVIDTGNGPDNVEIIDSIFENLEVNLGRGKDRLKLTGVEVKDRFKVDGGDDYDKLEDKKDKEHNKENKYGQKEVENCEEDDDDDDDDHDD